MDNKSIGAVSGLRKKQGEIFTFFPAVWALFLVGEESANDEQKPTKDRLRLKNTGRPNETLDLLQNIKALKDDLEQPCCRKVEL